VWSGVKRLAGVYCQTVALVCSGELRHAIELRLKTIAILGGLKGAYRQESKVILHDAAYHE
jgi:hypothetical protein